MTVSEVDAERQGSIYGLGGMTPTERIQLISELRRSFPAHKLLQEALADYEALAIEANRSEAATLTSAWHESRAAYMREHRKKERALIQRAKKLRKSKAAHSYVNG